MRPLLATLAAALPASGRVLDVGCGTGDAARVLQESRPDVRIAGVDADPYAGLASARASPGPAAPW